MLVPSKSGLRLFVFCLAAIQSTQIEIPLVVATVNGGVPGICKSGEQDIHESLLVVLLFLTSRSNLSAQGKQIVIGNLFSPSPQTSHNLSTVIIRSSSNTIVPSGVTPKTRVYT